MKRTLSSAALALLLSLSVRPLPQAEPRPVLWQVVERAVAGGGVEAPAKSVLEHLAGVPMQRLTVLRRPSRVDESLREPWRAPARAAELRDLLASPVSGRTPAELWSVIPGIAAWLDRSDYAEPAAAAEDPGLAELFFLWEGLQDEELMGLDLLEALRQYVRRAGDLLAETLESLDAEARALLFGSHVAFCEAWYRSHMPDNRAAEQPSAEQAALFERFKKDIILRDATNRARNLGIASALLRLGTAGFQASLATRLKDCPKPDAPAPAGFAGDILAVVGESAADRVVLGGPRKGRYEGPAALIVDLGGNDAYSRAAVVDDPEELVSIVLDLRGEDTYATETPGPAYAVGGVAILVDGAGNDRYSSARLGQGAAAFGFALLADLHGNDVYTMHDFGQGHALGGVGLLYDRAGDDRYEAWAYAQGGGLGYGFSALVDGAGDDSYLADLVWPDVYGDSGPDCYHGASQGYCSGLRPEVAGGIAALIDLGDGADRYQSGNFSQGGAYYFSFALMYDGGGDDESFGSRYSQGFGVHQGVALRWDAGGDDQVTCRSVAHAGMAWDESVGYFLDDAGDDEYRIGGLGLGGAAQTGIAIFVDGGGKDRYQGNETILGDTGGSEYHNKPSIGVMIDLGGDKDGYSAAGRSDNTVEIDDGVGVFIDTTAKTLEKALADRRLAR
ncbi:MAG: hypothetical protein AB1726_12985 [Planctomycetota bacterium]